MKSLEKKMRNKLEQITNLTVNNVLNNKIILPSSYFDRFNYYAKEMEINLDDDSFTKEIHDIIIEDFNKIEEYMKLIISSTITLQEESKNASTAILNKDTNSLNNVYEKMINLEEEIKTLTNQLFLDDTTGIFNRKWIYSKLLDENKNFKTDGICVLLDVMDYHYLQNEYGELLANNLLIFATNFISKKLTDENYNFQIARYVENKFFIFIFNETKQEVLNRILNLEQVLINTTLKSNSGLLIKAKYDFKVSLFKENQNSKDVFELLLAHKKEE
jgi:GGDEF domain-containing protein